MDFFNIINDSNAFAIDPFQTNGIQTCIDGIDVIKFKEECQRGLFVEYSLIDKALSLFKIPHFELISLAASGHTPDDALRAIVSYLLHRDYHLTDIIDICSEQHKAKVLETLQK